MIIRNRLDSDTPIYARPGLGRLVRTGQAPQPRTDVFVRPGVGQLRRTGAAPSLSIGSTGAGPSISNVTGTMSNGNTITIAGSSLMNQDTTNWRSFFTANPNRWSFEGASFTADGYTVMGNTGTAPTYDSTVALFGSKTAKFHIEQLTIQSPPWVCNDASGNEKCSCYVPNAWGASGETAGVYERHYVRYNGNGGLWPTNHCKNVEFFNGVLYLQPANSGSGAYPSNWLFFTTGSPAGTSVPIPSGQITDNRWYCIESYVQVLNAATRSIHGSMWIDGVQVVSNYQWTWSSGPQPSRELLFGIINACSPVQTYSLDCWMDGIVTSNARIRPAVVVELADGADYLTATKVYQAPEFLSDASVQFTFNSTGLSGSSRWVFVTDNRGNVSDGFQVV